MDGLKKEVSIKSVQWGIVSVLNRKDIEDPEKDKDYVLNATTMERIKKLCDIDEKEKGPEPKKRKT